MAAHIEKLSADSPIEKICAALRTDGAVVVERLIPEEVLSRVNREVDPYIEAADPGIEHLNPAIGAFFGNKTRHVAGVPGKSPTFADEVMIHPTLMAVCDEFLLPACARYQLNLGHILDRGPGSEQQWFHRDEQVWPHVPEPHPNIQVASIIALEDFTAEIGATLVVPGSHELPLERVPTDDEVAIAEMLAGSAVLYLGRTIHAGGANTTSDRWRRGLHTSWIVGWLRTEENNYLACPPDVARSLSRHAQEVLGYAVHDAIQAGGGYCGMLDMKDPVDLLADGSL